MRVVDQHFRPSGEQRREMRIRADAEQRDVQRGLLPQLLDQLLLVGGGRIGQHRIVLLVGGCGDLCGIARVSGHLVDVLLRHQPALHQDVQEPPRLLGVAVVAVLGHEPLVAPPDVHARGVQVIGQRVGADRAQHAIAVGPAGQRYIHAAAPRFGEQVPDRGQHAHGHSLRQNIGVRACYGFSLRHQLQLLCRSDSVFTRPKPAPGHGRVTVP